MRSPLALRIARNELDLGIPFPWADVIPDPLERYLVQEAVMTRFQVERDRAHADEQQKAAAAEAGQQLLAEHLRTRGEA